MDRRQRILQSVNPAGKGLEIGPSHSPIAPKREGFDVDVLDHCSREALIAKYTGHGVDLDAIEEVDFIYDGRRYPELIGLTNHYDWIIASHVIEHVPDLIGFLSDCAKLLRDGGVLSLVVPDMRFCFDRLRMPTGISQIIDAHTENRKMPSAGQVADYFLNVARLSDSISWDEGFAYSRSWQDIEFAHGVEDAKRGMQTVMNDGLYLDVHVWCFTPSSFRLLMDDLKRLGLTILSESRFHETVGNEFYVSLSKTDNCMVNDRLQLRRRVEDELFDVRFASAPIARG